jgi:mannose-6-phosphate isomerase-like protein (cupin superfamily)
MYGKSLTEINTKKKIFFYKKKKILFSKIFCETEYSFYKVLLNKNFYYKIADQSYLVFFLSDLKKKKSLFVKSKNFYFKSKNTEPCYIFFQKKKEELNIKSYSEKDLSRNKKNTNRIYYIKHQNIKKYWGNILTLLTNKKGAVKIINMKNNTQSSMEFHINKKESYYINFGKLYLGLRYGRAKQKIINLNKDESFLMKPGTMHMRMSKKDTNIIEMCTTDSNDDSIIVHDGKKYKFYEE